MARMLIVVALLSCGLIGCFGSPTTETRTLISTAAAVGAGDLVDWDAKDDKGAPKMTDAQKKRAHYKLTRVMYALDNLINEKAIPAAFSTDEPR